MLRRLGTLIITFYTTRLNRSHYPFSWQKTLPDGPLFTIWYHVIQRKRLINIISPGIYVLRSMINKEQLLIHHLSKKPTRRTVWLEKLPFRCPRLLRSSPSRSSTMQSDGHGSSTGSWNQIIRLTTT